MKIENTQNNVVGLPLNDSRGQGKGPAGASADVQDKLSLSDLTTRIRQPDPSTDSSTHIDLERVNAIRQAIENGSYQISSAGIANGLLDLTKP
jgi:negative regulator of flagellin synthesis FlgM